MNNKRWNGSGDGCPTCNALNGQIHPAQVWEDNKLHPGATRLICGEHCKCSLTATEEEERGDLSAVPYKENLQMSPDSLTIKLQTTSSANAQGFKILAISQGEAIGHGIKFSANVLRSALSIFDGIPVFLDHSVFMPSVKDLAGSVSAPVWNEQEQGIEMQLTPAPTPAGETLMKLREAALSDPALMKAIGFSSVILAAVDPQDNVTEIIRAFSVDAVIDPARGGKFLSVHFGKGVMMKEEAPSPALPVEEKIIANQQAAAQLLGENERIAKLEAQYQESEKTLIAQCEILLNAGLQASKLPEVVQSRLQKQFGGRKFTAVELQSAISEARAEVASLTDAQTVRGLPRIEGMTNSKDMFSAAVYDLMEVKRPDSLSKVKTHRLSGIREMYLAVTGDHDFMGRVDPQYFELSTSANLPNLLADAMNISVESAWATYAQAGYEWWKPIVDVRHSTNMQTPKGVLIGQVNKLPTISEGGAYTELALEDSKEVGAWTKSGGYIGLTLEMILKDETGKLKAYPRVLAFAGIRKLSSLVSTIFTTASGAGPTMADSKALFHVDHANLGTTALSAAEWEVASAAIYNQTMLVDGSDDGGKQAVDPKYLLVPRAMRLTARQILYPTLERASNIYTENLQMGDPGDVITVPEWTDANNWAAVVDPRIIPGIVVHEIFGLKPQIYTMDGETAYTMFMNDEMRIKSRHLVSVFVENHRPLYKENVA